jgi:hypothetical protein
MTLFSLPDCADLCGVSYNRFWYAVRVKRIPIEPQVVAGRQAYSVDDLPALKEFFSIKCKTGPIPKQRVSAI